LLTDAAADGDRGAPGRAKRLADDPANTETDALSLSIRGLARVLGDLRSGATRDDGVATAILALGDEIRNRCFFELSLDCSLTGLRWAQRGSGLDWLAHRGCAWSHRLLGNFDEAKRHYVACIRIGRETNDLEPIFWGRSGLTLVAQNRGNLPKAETMGERLAVWAARQGRADLSSHARNALGVTIGLRGRLRESLTQFELALPDATGEQRLRVLINAGVNHLKLGNLETARDVFLTVSRCESDLLIPLVADMNLIEVYAKLGQPDQIVLLRQRLEANSLPIELHVDFRLTLGQSYRILGDRAQAEACFRYAATLARQGGIGRGVIEAEDQLDRLAAEAKESANRAETEPLHSARETRAAEPARRAQPARMP
jgi:tetratricopeptide (TPR) repeat protein